MSLDIINCTWKFKFQCPRTWQGLRTTDDPKVRLCESCLCEVFLCESDEEVRQRAAQGACVAIAVGDGDDEHLLGDLIAPEPPELST